jgi:hypothetical protein
MRVLASVLVFGLVLSATAWATIPLETIPSWRSVESSYYSTGAILCDVNGDGFIEFLLSNGNDMRQSPQFVYYNDNGVLENSASWTSNDINYSGHSAIGDIDSDGYPDWAISNYIAPGWGATHSQLYKNIGGTFETSPSWVTSDAFHSFACAFGDADGDGDLDLAFACGEAYNNFAERNRIYYNNNGVLETTPSWVSDNSHYFYDVTWGDVDNDGDLDLAFIDSDGPIMVYYNHDGSIETSPSWQSVATDDGNTLIFGDINNDGYLDLAVANNYQLGGDGYFEAYMNLGGVLETTPSWVSSTYGYGAAVTFCDVDFDGDQDLAAGRWWGYTWMYENLEGELTTSPVWRCNSSYTSVVEELVWGDVDDDGVRYVERERKSGDGQKKVFYLNNYPAAALSSVVVDGQPLGLDQYCYDLACGWIALAEAPTNYIEVDYSFSIKPDLGVSNWDRDNYIFENLNGPFPEASVVVAPNDPPIEIPPEGGSFTYRGTLVNNLSQNIRGDVWVMVTLPNGNPYGPVFKVRPRLHPLEAITYTDLSQNVPGAAPEGEYLYTAYVGRYPSVKIDSSSLTFTKLGVTSTGEGGWTCSGFRSSEDPLWEASLPTDLVYLDNFPNPFNLATEVFFNMPQGGQVSLEVYDLLGRKIDTVFEGFRPAGRHQLVWEAEALASGIYFLRLSVGETATTRSVTLLK